MRRLVCALVLLSAAPAHAQELTEHFDVEGFTPEPGRASVVGLVGAATPGHLSAVASMWLHYAHRPLVARLLAPDGTARELAVIDGRWTMDVGLGLGLGRAWMVSAALPVVMNQSGAGLGVNPVDGAGTVDGFALGDARLGARWRFLDVEPVRVALGGVMGLPTGADAGFVSDGRVRGEPFLASDVRVGPATATVNLGYALRGARTAHNFRSDDALRWGVGGRVNVVPGLDLGSSVRGTHSLLRTPDPEDPGILIANTQAHPIELVGAASWSLRGVTMTLGAGTALNESVGVPRYRVLFGLGYALDAVPRRDVRGAADDANDREAPHDPDGDGLTRDDLCPDTPGPRTEGGCPAFDTPDAQASTPIAGAPLADAAVDDAPTTAPVALRGDRVEIVESVYFDTDRATIQQRSLPILDHVAEFLQRHPRVRLLSIDGHTDDRGSASHNLDLSARRAGAVRAYLIERGIDAGRLRAMGYGESHPIAPNDSEAARARNRRVEFLVLELEETP